MAVLVELLLFFYYVIVCTRGPTYTAVKAVIASIENKANWRCGFEQHLPFDYDLCDRVIEVFLDVLGVAGGWVFDDVYWRLHGWSSSRFVLLV